MSNQFFVAPDLAYSSILRIVTAHVKPLGIRVICVCANTRTAKLLQKAFEEAEMNTQGYVIILTCDSAWDAELEGAILLQQGNFLPRNLTDRIDMLIKESTELVISIFDSNSIQSHYSAYTLEKSLSEERDKLIEYSLYNVVNKESKRVGKIENFNVIMNESILFPGKSTEIPDNSKIKIQFSFAGGISNPNGLAYPTNGELLQAAVEAVKTINNDQTPLENFELSYVNISDCGSSYFDVDFSKNCFKNHKKDIGIFHIPPFLSPMALGTFGVFKALEINAPLIGTQTAAEMSDLKYYPQYSRVAFANSYTGAAAALMFSAFGIERISFLYTNTV